MKGLPIYAVAVNKILSIWFSSPTGDSSDSYVYNITCKDESQAEKLAEAYRKIINEVDGEEIIELNRQLDMYKLAYDSHRQIIADLKEQLKASEQWFDQTVSI
jgi:hypothetical protein